MVVDALKAFLSFYMSNCAVRAAGYAGEASVSLQCPCPSGSERLTEAGPFSQRLSLCLVSILPVWAAAELSIHTPHNEEKRGTQRIPGGGGSWSNMRRTCCEEPGGDGFVILVIKDRVASMPGVRTGCGKLLESLGRKAAPSLFYPFSRDLIIFSNSQDGILYPLFPHLLLPSSCLCSFPFASLCHFVLKPIGNSELTKRSRPMAELSEWNIKTLSFLFRQSTLVKCF